MQAKRIEQLKNFQKEDPSDPFPKYALALEYLAHQPEKSKALFEELLEKHPHYSATYYHAADFFYRIDEIEKARAVYSKGIEILKSTDDTKALRELQNAYQNFQFEVDY
ncbi:MAG: tetratricopeptide repeat protein [Cyclobacteriaceae bacterium]|jgi:Tfp pilus assembly protein PilF